MYKITDWTGRDCFHGQTFNTMHDADDYLVEHLHRVHPNATEEEFDAIRGEFYVEPVKQARINQLEQEIRDLRDSQPN